MYINCIIHLSGWLKYHDIFIYINLMLFSEAFIDELKQRLTLSKIISKTVKLKRNGPVYKGLCPFHQEKTPSFTVQDHRGTYYCFGCHASGDVISFVNQTEKTSFEDTVTYLANLAGMELPKQNAAEQQEVKHKHSLVEVLVKATKWFQNQLRLSINHEAYEYLERRGIDNEDIEKFSLGYAPSNGLVAFLQKEGISIELAIEVGLVIKSSSGYVERFRNRVIFPIKNLKNQIVGFGGRALSSEIMPKYLNSPETVLFKKNNLLYGMDIASKQSFKTDRVIVVEGYMDAIFMHKAGFHETVASLGTAFNQTHLNILWSMVNEPILCFDGDEAGLKAMSKAAYVALPLLKPGITLKFVFLPKNSDPDDVIKQSGASYIKKLIESSVNLSDFIWREELKQVNMATPEGKALLEHKVYELVKQISNINVRNYYHQFMKERLWKENSTFKINKAQQAKGLRSGTMNVISDLSIEERLEYSMFAKLISYPMLLEDNEIFENFYSIEITNLELDNLRSILFECIENKDLLLNDLLIQNNLVKLAEFLCGKESSFINNVSEIDAVRAKEVWLITYKKYILEKMKNEYNRFIQKSSVEIGFFEKATELKDAINDLIIEITNKENNLI